MADGAVSSILAPLGERPKLIWLPIGKLHVDQVYQRSAAGTASQKLIQHIARNFSWSKFQVLTVTEVPSEGWTVDGWLVIDGQHRLAGALMRADIDELPCIVLDLPDRAAQARAFVALNRDRVAMSRMAMHHAAVAAGDPDAIQLGEICAAAGVEITRGPIPKTSLKAHQSLSVATLTKILADQGADCLGWTLRTMRSAWPSTPSLTADLMSGIATMGSTFLTRIDDPHLVSVLQMRNPDSWIERGRRHKEPGGRIGNAIMQVIVRSYNSKVVGDLPKLVEARR